MTNEKKKNHSIAHTVIVGYIGLAVILVVTLTLVVGFRYRDTVYASISENANMHAKIAAKFIRGSTIDDYLESGYTDTYYYTVQSFLDSHKDEKFLMYYYVGVIDGNDIIYIWDTDESSNNFALGERETYSEEGMQAFYQSLEEFGDADLIVTNDEYGYLGTAVAPITDNNDEVVAFVAVDVHMNYINRQINKFLIPMILTIIIIILISMLIGYYFIHLNLISPIKKLTYEANNMVTHLSDRDDVRIEFKTNNELQDLADGFNKMYTDVTNYVKQLKTVTKEKERISTELHVAKHIQSDMLPKEFPFQSDRNEFDLYAIMNPAKEVGGDFYDYFMLDDDHLALVVGDVSGKGVPAALFMAISKTLIHNYTAMKLPVNEVFEKVNNDLYAENESLLFTTAWLGIYEISTQKLCFADAGHEIALVKSNDGTIRQLKPVKKNVVLAAMDGMQYSINEAKLEKGEMLLLYTDGVPEATNENNELYGMERLIETFHNCHTNSPTELLTMIRKDVNDFVGETPQFDDITMLSIKILE